MSGGPGRSRCSPQARSGGKPTTRAAAWSSAPGPGMPCCPSARRPARVTPVLCVRGDDTRLFDVKPNAAPAPPTAEPDPPRSERTAPATGPRAGGPARSLQVQPAEGATRGGGPTRLARRVWPWRGRVYAAAAALVLTAAGTAAILLIPDREPPAGNEITATAPWRLLISDKMANGCDVTLTDTATGLDVLTGQVGRVGVTTRCDVT